MKKMNNSSAIDNNNDKQHNNGISETTVHNIMILKFYPPFRLSLSLSLRKKSDKMLWLLLLRRVTGIFCYP